MIMKVEGNGYHQNVIFADSTMHWRTLALWSEDLNGKEKNGVSDPPPWSNVLSIYLLD